MRITSVKKRGRHFSVKVTDLEIPARIHTDTMFQFSLYEGMELTPEQWKKLLDANNFAFAWESALRMLSVRAHCVQDIKNKLKQKKFTAAAVEKVLGECARLGLVDDAKFAKAYIAELKDSGSGLQMIKMKLAKKGVPREIAEEELENSFTKADELTAAATALKKKLPALRREKDPAKRKQKFFRYMASRGFNYEIIEQILNSEDYLTI